MSEVDILREIEKHRRAIEYLQSLDQAAGGGGGAAHDILSATHLDTDGIGTELVGDYLYNDGADWRPRLPLYAKPFDVVGASPLHNYDPGGEYQCYRTYRGTTFTGFARGVDGKLLLIWARPQEGFVGGAKLVIESASSVAANRIYSGSVSGITLEFYSHALLRYDATAQGTGRWVVVFISNDTTPLDIEITVKSRSWFGV